MQETTHLDSLNLRLSHERSYLEKANTEKEKQIRKIWIKQIEKEIEIEEKLLGLKEIENSNLNDEELLNELFNN